MPPTAVVSLLLTSLVTSHLSAASVLELDASVFPTGEITEAQSQLFGGRWQPNMALRVEEVGGRKAFVFDGAQQLISEVLSPDRWPAFTVEAWVRNPEVDRHETVAAFSGIKGGMGTEFKFGTSPSAGAFRSGFKATTPFLSVPSAGAWHHLAWTYENGVLRIFVDGEAELERTMKVTLPMPLKVHVGASGEVDNKGPRNAFSGAIAKVKISDTALTEEALRASAGFTAPFRPEPPNGATTETLNVTLHWQPGTKAPASFVLYAGPDRAAVERGEATLATPVKDNASPPIALRLGAPYFWRVEQQVGSATTSSPVWTFTADPGLAVNPEPRDATSNTPVSLATLRWKPGKYATTQRLFFGRSLDEVEHSTKAAAELPPNTSTYSVPSALAPGTRYFWRVESDNGGQPVTHGTVWSFRTQDAPVEHDITFFVSSDCHYGRENNAEINRRVIDAMNTLPGAVIPASVGGGYVRTPRGVILNGDLLDEGFNKETAPALWQEFCRDYGLTGSDGRLCYPLYEGFGNHDGGPTKSFVRAGIKERNPKRTGLCEISPDGHHYSWDWDHVHCVQLNLFGGEGPQDVKGVNGPEHDPEGSLDFLRADLAKHVGSSGRPVIVFQHFAWIGGMSDWWQLEAKERFYEVVKPYHVACLINGHSHGASFAPWHDLLTVHDGSTARGESDSGDFLVVRVTDRELIIAQRKLDGTWGIQMRRSLNSQEFLRDK